MQTDRDNDYLTLQLHNFTSEGFVNKQEFTVMDNVVQLGGENLSGKEICGGRVDSALLSRLCTEGWLFKKASKYSITVEGRARHAQENTAEAQQRRHEKELLRLLELLEARGWKLNAAQLASHQPLLQELCALLWIETTAKANVFRLLPTGADKLQSSKPIKEQVEGLLAEIRKNIATARIACQSVETKAAELRNAEPIMNEVARVKAHFQHATDNFLNSLHELSAFGGLLQAAHEFQAANQLACDPIVTKLDQLIQREKELQDLLQKMIAEHLSELAKAEERMEKKAGEFTAAAVSASPILPNQSPQHMPDPDENHLWESAQKAYREVKKSKESLGGIVTIPELVDALKIEYPSFDMSRIPDLLQRWQAHDRLTLQVCNDPHLVPRSEEGIHSPHGLLFYISMRD